MVAGYSGNYVSVVWVGRDDNQPIGLSGGSGALPIWNDYMGRLRLSPVSLVQPEDIEWLWLDNGTGKLSNEACDGAKYLPVWSKYVPKVASDCAIALYQNQQALEQFEWIMSQQGQPSTPDSTPSEAIADGVTDSDNTNVDAPVMDDGSASPSAEERADTWYDKAVEWF